MAKRAGVGIGTLYRHFPTRDALVEAAYRAEVADLCETAGALLAAHPADEALAEWMDRFVAYSTAKKGMKGALQSVVAGGSDIFAETRGQIVARDRGPARGGRRGPARCAPTSTPRTSGARWAASGSSTTSSRRARCCGC